MCKLKTLIQVCLFASIFTTIFSNALGVPAFTITPLMTSATVKSIGQTSVRYTITNEASASIPNLSITPSWNSSGVGLSLSNDNCSGSTLGAGQTCTFDITIPGENQPSSFTLQPKVCGFSEQLCAQAATTFPVTVIQHTLPTRIYEVIFPAGTATEKLVGINTADSNDIIRATIANPKTDGPLVVSPDGSKVYMIHSNGDSTFSLLVFDVTATTLTQSSTSYSIAYNDKNLNAAAGQIAITPDGNTLYITDSGYTGTGYPVYRIDLSSSDTSTAVTGISDATTGGVALNPKGIVISSDGKTVYFANSSSDTNNIFSFANSASTTSVSTIVHATDLTTIRILLMSSDGSTIYAGGQISSDVFEAVIEKYNVTNNFSIASTFSPAPDDNGNAFSAALSPDNTKIYSIVQNASEGVFYLYTITTTSMTAPTGATYPYNIAFPLQNFNYITITPDGSTVAILNYGTDGNSTGLFNPASPSNVTTVNPAGSGLTMYSYTWGSFSG